MLEPDRPKQRRSLSRSSASPNQETSVPDRNAALNMLGTFDLEGVDGGSPDEILGTLVAEKTEITQQFFEADEGADTGGTSAVENGQSDEILRELEEHHQRGAPAPRSSAPRGSAELQSRSRHQARAARRPIIRVRDFRETKPHGRRRWLAVSVALALAAALAMAGMLSQLGGKSVAPPTPQGSSRLGATTTFTLAPSKFLAAAANAIANEGRRLARRHGSPTTSRRPVGHTRKRSKRHHAVTRASAGRAASTPAANSAPVYRSVSSTSVSSSQPVTGTGATTTSESTSDQSQPAFGQNGSLGPGRGASSTQ